MTLTLEIAPKLQHDLEVAARHEGRSIAEYAAQLLRDAHAARQSAIAAKLAMLDEWEKAVAARPDYRAQAGLGPLPDDAIEDAYREREDAQL